MIVINRSRNSGKTTILLHHMVVTPLAIYVARTEKAAERAYLLSQSLGLDLALPRFVGMACDRLEKFYQHGYEILVDDADYITQCHSTLGFNLIAHASIITVTK
jgi:hypothetical protein